MLQLRLVKTQKEEVILNSNSDYNSVLHGTEILKQLVQPWAYSNRAVYADSYFASGGATNARMLYGSKFIGVINTSTRKYSMGWISNVELRSRGDMKGLVHKDGNGMPIIMAFVWMECDRYYFIDSTSCLTKGRPYARERRQQVDQGVM